METLDRFPDVAVESLRKIIPYPRAKPVELKSLRAALERLCAGEANGMAMNPPEAIGFLRGKLVEASQALAGREKRWTPHLSTWLNQRRYLTPTLPPPENLEEAMSILGCYPTITAVDVAAHMPVLRVIDEHIKFYQATHGSAAASYIRTRTLRFAECVDRWPAGEMQFVPGADRFFKERRYEQDEKWWNRTQSHGFESEREQILRIM